MKILLVDDALDMRLVMKRTLTLMGHEVQVAEDGVVAWELLQKEAFQVVITDWVMPRMDGPELCRRIRDEEFSNYIYIILLTGMSGKPNFIVGMDAGADDFANKPIEHDEMIVRLRAAERVITLEQQLAQQNKNLASANDSLRQAQDEIQRDLRHASALQMGILPVEKQIGNLNFAWLFRPTSYIGGDTFNYFPLEEGLCLFYTVDVSGHGISSALLSMYLSNLLTSSADRTVSDWQNLGEEGLRKQLSEMIHSFNEHLLDVLDFSDHYFTMILGVIDTREERLHFVQAGHPKPFFVDTVSKEVTELDCTGFPVGLVPGVSYETVSMTFNKGSRLAVFSDGLFEMSNDQGELFTEDDLGKALEDAAHLTSADTVKSVFNHFMLEKNEENQPDDLSLLVVDFN